jgi:hypothetical protein
VTPDTSIVNSAWAQAAFAGVLFVVMAVAVVALWRRNTVIQDREAERLGASIKADVEASGALRDVAGAVVSLKGEVSALRTDIASRGGRT